ncbi:MAG: hypothetical protein E4G90_08255 [Gemmatimonadales bacterium]|nr:MAG: hypothetical protein E4G90_08255 [Gemmatimonadales bacterium]
MNRFLIVLVLLTGCVHVSKSVLMDRSSMPVPKESVYVFLASDTIPNSCERVAILHASGEQDWTDEGQMIDELRSEAGKLGANALHLLTMEDAGTGERVVAALFDTQADRDADALALWCPGRS